MGAKIFKFISESTHASTFSLVVFELPSTPGLSPDRFARPTVTAEISELPVVQTPVKDLATSSDMLASKASAVGALLF